jgi:hypothetical protein
MPDAPSPWPWKNGLLVVQYLFMFGSTFALLHFVGLGWIGSVVGGLILTGAFFTFIVLVLRQRR